MRTETAGSRRAGWAVPVALVALALVPSVAGLLRLADLAGGAPVSPGAARFRAHPVPVVLHIMAAVPFGLLGALQFGSGARRRPRRWHRAAGRALAPLGLVVAPTGLWMTMTYPWPAGDGLVLYGQRLVFGTAMVASLVAGLEAIRRGNFAAHGAWMTRAYALGMGAGTQVFTHLVWWQLVGRPGEAERALLMGAGWGINLLVAEWAIRGRSAPRPGAPRPREAILPG